MITQKVTLEITQPLSYEQRRAFHQLPLAERRKLLAEQADHAVTHYEEAQATQEREKWQGGDILEPKALLNDGWGAPFRVPPLGGIGGFSRLVSWLKPPIPPKGGTLNGGFD